MAFESGQRIPGLRWSHYVIVDQAEFSSGSPLYRAQKIMFNHRYDEQEFYETDPSEWLPVWVRTVSDSVSYDPQEQESRLKLLQYERDSVLGHSSRWTPEPLDWLSFSQNDDAGAKENPESEGTSESFPTTMLVFSALQGETLAEAHQNWPTDSLLRIRFLTEWLHFLEELHAGGQTSGGFAPTEIIVDSSGMFQVLATHRILPIEQTQKLRWYFPPELFPAGFAAPETASPERGYEPSGDLYNWGILALWLLTGVTPEERPQEELSEEEQKHLQQALENHLKRHPEAMRVLAYERFAESTANLVETWVNVIAASLHRDPQKRPASVSALRYYRTTGESSRGLSGKIKSWFRPVETS